MMRSLAEFIMRGRLQASVLAMLSVMLPLLPQAAVGLVTLRKGVQEGALMTAVGMLPLLIALVFGQPDGAVFWGTLLGLLAVYLPAIALRATRSWPFALQVAIVASGSLSIVLLLLLPSLNTAFTEVLQRLLMFSTVPTKTAEGEGIETFALSFTRVSGFVSVIMLLNGLTGLLLARWWQALLYNPGGFGEEFHHLQLGILSSIVLAALAVLCFLQGPEYDFWASVLMIPLVLVAMAIVHYVARSRSLHRRWIVVFYLLMVFFSPFLIVLAAIGFIDSFVQIRQRLSHQSNDK